MRMAPEYLEPMVPQPATSNPGERLPTCCTLAQPAGLNLPSVEAKPGQRLGDLVLLVGQVRLQGVGQNVDCFLQLAEVARVGDEAHQRPVDVLADLMEDHMVLPESVDDRAKARIGPAQMREDRP